MQDRPSPTTAQSVGVAAGFIALCLAVSALGGLATASSVGTWYAGLNKPSFNPPNTIFAPVWTTLYVMIGLAGWRIWRAVGFTDKKAFTVYGVQLALNLAWSFLFFGAQQIAAAFIEIIVLWVAIAWTIRLFWHRDKIAALLLAPYLAWVSFATVLTGAIWRLNP